MPGNSKPEALRFVLIAAAPAVVSIVSLICLWSTFDESYSNPGIYAAQRILILTAAAGILSGIGLFIHNQKRLHEALKELAQLLRDQFSNDTATPESIDDLEQFKLAVEHSLSSFGDLRRDLQEARTRERLIADSTRSLTCTLDEGYRFLKVNAQVRELWGYEPQELAGRRIIDVIVEADIKETASTLKRTSKRQDLSFQNRIRRKDNSFEPVSWNMRWSSEDKNYICVVQSITTPKSVESILQQTESRVKMLIESMPVTLLIVSQDREIELTNIKAEKMFGYKNHELAGKNLSMLFVSTDSRAKVDGKSELNLAEGTVSLDALKKDGSRLPVDLTISGLDLEGASKFLIVVLDVTERREVERLKKEFVQMVSHDLRSPLTAIMGTLHLLKEGSYGKINKKGDEILSRTEDEFKRLIELIDGLLDLEKMQAGKMQIDKQVIDISSVVSRAVNSVSYLASKNSIKLESSGDFLEALADGSKLVQVIVNLLSNAIKFSPPNSTIRIEYEELDDCILIKIKDQGRGIAEADLGRVFERFKQIERGDELELHGKGLGLAIAKEIVEAHGGEIGVESKLGVGSTFWFKIPQPS